MRYAVPRVSMLPVAAAALILSGTGVAAAAMPLSAHAQQSPIPPLGPGQPLKLPKIVQKTLANGVRLVLLEDHAQPAIWIRLALPAGSIRDPKEKVGLAQMTAALLDKGTATRTETQIADAVDILGASLGASANDDNLIVSASGLSVHADTLLDLMADITLRPTFPQQEIDRYRTRTLNSLRASLAEPDVMADLALARLVFGEHPYGNNSAGTPQTLPRITQADLKSFHDTYFAANEATLFIAGDITEAEATAKAEKAFAGWARKNVAPAPPAPRPAGQVPDSARPRIVIIDRPGAPQTQVRIGTLAAPYNDPQRTTGSVATAVLGLGNFEGRLTREIRVKRGLTYGVASYFSRNRLGGSFQITTFTNTPTTGEVVRLALEEAQKLAQTAPPAEELQDRKTFLTGLFDLSVTTPAGVLSRLIPAVLFGSGPQELETYSSRVNAATPESIRETIDKLPLEQASVVLVGSAKDIEPQVRPLGEIVAIVPMEQVDLLSPTLKPDAPPSGAASATPAPSPEAATEGAALLSKAVRAHGGQAFLNLTAVRFVGKGMLSPPGSEGLQIPLSAVTLVALPPDRSRLDMKSDLGEFAFASMGGDKGGWISAMGNIQTLTAAQANSAEPLAFLRMAAKQSLATRPLTAAPAAPQGENKKMTGFAVTGKDGRVTDFHIEEETGLVRRIVSQGQQGESVTHLGGYKSVDGVMLPTSMRTLQNGKDFLTLTFDTLEINKPVAETSFDRPKGP